MSKTLREFALELDGAFFGDGSFLVEGVAPLPTAQKMQISFVVSKKHLAAAQESQAGAFILPENLELPNKNGIHVKNPRLAMAKIAHHFYALPRPPAGISSLVQIGANVTLGDNVSIGSFVVIEDNVTIENGVSILPHGYIGKDVKIGKDTFLHPHVTISHGCIIGQNVQIQAGTVVGSDGFGYVSDDNAQLKVPHTGIVQIDDNVELGAQNTIDRGTFGKTWLKKGVKTDNQVHIGHNVEVGEQTLIIAQTGIGGSAKIGSHCIIAGHVVVRDQITIGDRSLVGAKTTVSQSIPAGSMVSFCIPEIPHMDAMRIARIIPRLPELRKRLEKLERDLGHKEKN